MMVFIVLGVVQLGMMHQARLMTEYAAYRAARAGIVNHGDCDLMEESAYMAVLPTLGPPPSGGPGRVDTLARAMSVYWQYKDIPTNKRYLPSTLPRIRLEILNPKKSQLSGLFSNYGSHLNQREIDYDDIRDATVIEANLLSVRVTYFYNMRIPFANWLMHSFFMGREVLGDLRGVQFEVQKARGQYATSYLENYGASKGADYAQMKLLSTRGTFVIPLISTYSMRMQSNYLNNGSYGPGKCAIN